MTTLRWANRAYAHLASALSRTGTTMYLVPGESLPWVGLLAGGDAFYLTLFDGAGNLEVVQVTSMTGDAFTVSRGQLATTARAWTAGTQIAQRVTSGCLNAMLQAGTEVSGTYNPHGVLTADYVGQKFYDSLNDRHFISLGGTNWKLLTGELLGTEVYDDDGFPVSEPERWLVLTDDILVQYWQAYEGGAPKNQPNYPYISHGIAGPGAAPSSFNDMRATSLAGYYRGHLTDPGGSLVGLVTMRLKAWHNHTGMGQPEGDDWPILGFQLFHGTTPWSDEAILTAAGDGDMDYPAGPPGFGTATHDWILGPISAAQANDLRLYIDVKSKESGKPIYINEIEFEVD